ncbi:MAG: FkbM family methyltransferase [Rhodospirillales bacterium]
MTPRRFVEVTGLPVLARMQVTDPNRKPTGAKRWQRKIARSVHGLFHTTLGFRLHGTLTVVTADGTRVPVRIDARQSVYIDFASRDRHGGYEPAETLLIDALLPKADVFFDIGSNWGYYTLLAATNPSFGGTVFAFDVQPAINDALAAMTRQLGLTLVHVMGFGLSERGGTVEISRERHIHLTRVLNAPTVRQKTIAADVKALDQLDLPPPQLIKMDVEDHELSVLHGGEKVISRNRPAVLFECRSDGGNGAVTGFFTERDYEIFAVENVTPDRRHVMLRTLQRHGAMHHGPNVLALPTERRNFWLGL